MKNMKKLLGAMAALGFTTLGAVNVVACNNSSTSTNDLTKSYETSYSKDVNTTTITTSGLGLTANATTPANFDFKISGLTAISLNAVVTPKASGATISNPITITDASAATAPTKADLLLAVATGADQTNLVPSGTTKVVTFKITLTLWKSQLKSGSTTAFEYKATATTMDVTINLATNPSSAKTALGDIIVNKNLDNIAIAGTAPTAAELLTGIKAKNPDTTANLTVSDFTIKGTATDTAATITGAGKYQGDVALTYSRTQTALSSVIPTTELGRIAMAGSIPTAAELLTGIKAKNPDTAANLTVSDFTIKGTASDVGATITGALNYQGDVALTYTKQ